MRACCACCACCADCWGPNDMHCLSACKAACRTASHRFMHAATCAVVHSSLASPSTTCSSRSEQQGRTSTPQSSAPSAAAATTPAGPPADCSSCFRSQGTTGGFVASKLSHTATAWASVAGLASVCRQPSRCALTCGSVPAAVNSLLITCNAASKHVVAVHAWHQ